MFNWTTNSTGGATVKPYTKTYRADCTSKGILGNLVFAVRCISSGKQQKVQKLIGDNSFPSFIKQERKKATHRSQGCFRWTIDVWSTEN